jgi:hypothetical protein
VKISGSFEAVSLATSARSRCQPLAFEHTGRDACAEHYGEAAAGAASPNRMPPEKSRPKVSSGRNEEELIEMRPAILVRFPDRRRLGRSRLVDREDSQRKKAASKRFRDAWTYPPRSWKFPGGVAGW